MVGRIPLIACLLAAAVPSAATAQCRLCTAPTTTPETVTAAPVQLQIEANLDFDRLVLAGSGSGSAILAPDGSHSMSGGIVAIGPRAMVGRVTVRGEPGRSVRVSLPGTIMLYGPAGQLRIDSVRSDLPSLPRIGADGALSFRFGGELHVAGAIDGDFRGDFQVDVDYL